MGAVLAQENRQELPDLANHSLILLRLDLRIVLTSLAKAQLPLLIELFNHGNELLDEEDTVSFLKFLAGDVQEV